LRREEQKLESCGTELLMPIAERAQSADVAAGQSPAMLVGRGSSCFRQ
jgi:hypothetical protein